MFDVNHFTLRIKPPKIIYKQKSEHLLYGSMSFAETAALHRRKTVDDRIKFV